MSATAKDRAALVELLDEFFPSANVIADMVIGAGWVPPDRNRSQIRLGANEIAERLGLGLSVPVGWRRRYHDSSDPFPAPDGTQGGKGYWFENRWPEIDAWYQRHLKHSTRTDALAREGYVSSSAICVWFRQPGWWVSKVRSGIITVHAPFPEPDKIVQKPRSALALWSVHRRPEIEAWYRDWSTWAAQQTR